MYRASYKMECKIFVLGDSAVGKTCLVNMFLGCRIQNQVRQIPHDSRGSDASVSTWLQSCRTWALLLVWQSSQLGGGRDQPSPNPHTLNMLVPQHYPPWVHSYSVVLYSTQLTRQLFPGLSWGGTCSCIGTLHREAIVQRSDLSGIHAARPTPGPSAKIIIMHDLNLDTWV